MYYFHFYIDDNPSNDSPRKDRLARLKRLAFVHNGTCDIQYHKTYSTAVVTFSNTFNANNFKMFAEEPLYEGASHYTGMDKLD